MPDFADHAVGGVSEWSEYNARNLNKSLSPKCNLTF